MSDNIFNYFSNKGTRKVDPIDDAEFESIDAPKTPPEPPKPIESAAKSDATLPTETRPDHGRAPRSGASRTPSKPAAQAMEAGDSPVQPKKSQSHWDYLASLLGIKKEAPVEQHHGPASAEKDETGLELEQPVSRSSLFDEPEEQPQEAAILNDMFQPVSHSVNVDSEPEGVFADSDSDSDLEYVEFEVEELETNTDSDESERRTRRAPHRESADRPKNDGSRQGREVAPRDKRGRRDREYEEPALDAGQPSRSREGRSREGRSREGRDVREVREVRDEPRQSFDAPHESKRPESRTGRREDRVSAPRNPVAQTPVDEGFGAGVFDSSRPLDENQPQGDSMRRKRRRRRRTRGGSKSESEMVSGLPRMSPLPEVDPPENFFYETGWQPSQLERSSRPKSSADFDDDFEDDGPARKENVGAESTDRESAERSAPRKRRRRRGFKGTGDNTVLPGIDDRSPKATTWRSEAKDDLDDDEDGFDYDRAHRKPKLAGPVDDSARSTEPESRHPDDRTGVKKKFPTWEEAIAGMVESNIKNHSRSSGQNRGGNKRGRRRR